MICLDARATKNRPCTSVVEKTRDYDREALHATAAHECFHLCFRIPAWLFWLYKTNTKSKTPPQSRWLCSGQCEYGATACGRRTIRWKEDRPYHLQCKQLKYKEINAAAVAALTADDGQHPSAWAHFASAPELLAAFSNCSCLCSS